MTHPAVCLPLSDAELRRFVARDDDSLGALSSPRGRLPLTALHVDARIDGLVAEIDIEQVFRNTLNEPIEAVYIFPLPDRASVATL